MLVLLRAFLGEKKNTEWFAASDLVSACNKLEFTVTFLGRLDVSIIRKQVCCFGHSERKLSTAMPAAVTGSN